MSLERRRAEGGGLRALLLFVLLLLFAALQPAIAAAQSVRGQILDRDTEAPVDGALAILLGPEGEREGGVLTNDTGWFLLQAPEPGRYTVRIERIGYETVTSEPFDLSPGQMHGLRLFTGQTAIELEGLEVEGEKRCVVRPGEGMEVARVWEEARKALTVQSWAEQEGSYRYTLVNYERELDARSLRVESESRKVRRAVARNPIRSLPPEELMEEGFIREDPSGGWIYYGPDASVLLSDVFLDTHCFRLIFDRDYPEAVGLSFEPVGRGGRPDIRGTLWLDRETARLDFLEYRYTWAPRQEARGMARGRVEFEELPNGAWIVRRWWIRMPVLVQGLRSWGGGSGVWVDAYQEAGGEVTEITTLDREETVLRTEKGTVQGRVWDSLRHVPLTGARVFLSGTQHVAQTNQEGEFVLRGLPRGRFTVAFTHPRLDTLGFYPPGARVEVVPGDTSRVELGIPSTRGLVSAACPDSVLESGVGVLTGQVVDEETGRPVSSAEVRVWWEGYEISPGGGIVVEQGRQAEAVTDAQGRYTICGVPAEEEIAVRATHLGRLGRVVVTRLREGAFAVLDLEIDRD